MVDFKNSIKKYLDLDIVAIASQCQFKKVSSSWSL